MINTIITFDRNIKTADVEKEWRYNFIHEVLQAMGIPVENIWLELTLDAESKQRLVDLLNHYDIQIYEDIEGVVEIFYKKDSIARWNKPKFRFKQDLSLSREKQVYLEMITDYWSLYHREPNDQ